MRNQALILFIGSLIDSCIYILYVYIYIIESTLSSLFLESEAPGNSPLQMQDFKNDIIYIESTVYLHVYIYTLYITMYTTYTKYIQIQKYACMHVVYTKANNNKDIR